MRQSETATTETLQLECPLGTVAYRADEVLRFTDGLFGYEERKAFLHYRHPQFLPFGWLIDVNDPGLIFPVITASDLSSDYKPEIPDAQPHEDCHVIVAIGNEIEGVTANLRAPLLLSETQRTGRQVILTDSSFPLRFPLARHAKTGE